MGLYFNYLTLSFNASNYFDGCLCRYEHLEKSASTILDDSLSADAYLNVLYMPSTFPRSERSRRSERFANNQSISDFEDGPRSNLDSVRYVECIYYLQEVSSHFLQTTWIMFDVLNALIICTCHSF